MLGAKVVYVLLCYAAVLTIYAQYYARILCPADCLGNYTVN